MRSQFNYDIIFQWQVRMSPLLTPAEGARGVGACEECELVVSRDQRGHVTVLPS